MNRSKAAMSPCVQRELKFFCFCGGCAQNVQHLTHGASVTKLQWSWFIPWALVEAGRPCWQRFWLFSAPDWPEVNLSYFHAEGDLSEKTIELPQEERHSAKFASAGNLTWVSGRRCNESLHIGQKIFQTKKKLNFCGVPRKEHRHWNQKPETSMPSALACASSGNFLFHLTEARTEQLWHVHQFPCCPSSESRDDEATFN